ncbi:MAG: tyrosine-type recombinase/integrase [Paludibacteraceae bacterium]|nr:tyrosine-type recombinase/integrase [Paludibacteraceae bacterium]MBR6041609.1 tyrosine-type recombinase/integrase [Paludibacteraceae bacterium]
MFIEKFLQYIKYEKAYSSHTFISYQTDMEQFAAFVEQQKGGFNPPEITANDIRSWILSIMDNGVGARSVNRKLTTLRTFFKYMMRQGVLSVDPTAKVKPPKMEKRLPVFLREEQVENLFDEFGNVFPDDFEGKRDRILLEILYNLGVRESELINLKDCDFDFNRNTVRVTGKRNKQRYIPFGDRLKKDILAYVDDRNSEVGPVEDGWLLVRKTGEQLYPVLVWRIVEKYISSVSTLSKRSPHVLRHTFATAMLNNGADIDAVKELLGHANLAATEVYTHTTFDRLRKIYKQAHPRA